MRKYILIFIGVMIFGDISGQFTPGQMLYNGHFYLGSNKNHTEGSNLFGETKSSSEVFAFDIGVTAGVFITKNFMLGVTGNYYSYSQQNEFENEQPEGISTDIRETTIQTFGIGIEARRYFTLTEKAFFILQGQGSYSYNIQKTDNRSIVDPFDASPDISNQISESTSNAFNLSIRPGLAFALSSNLFLEAFFGRFSYNQRLSKSETNTETSKTNGSQFYASFSSIDLLIGLSLVF